MTDISVSTVATYVTDSRAWLAGPHGTEPGMTPSITLDFTLFVEATHFPDGFLPSGTPLGEVTLTGKYGPYDDTAEDGRETLAGLLFSFVKPNSDLTKPVGGALFVHGAVVEAKLPIAIDAAAKADTKGAIFYL